MTKLSGPGTCLDCGATVNYRETRGGYVMYHCNAEIVDTACKGRHTFGPRNSRDLLNQMEKAQTNERQETRIIESKEAGPVTTSGGDGGKPAGNRAGKPKRSILENILFDE